MFSFLPILGFSVLILAWVIALFGALSAMLPVIRGRSDWLIFTRWAIQAVFALLSLAVLCLLILIFNDRFEVHAVYMVSSRTLPLMNKVSALWGGQAGSLLFWGWMLSAVSCQAVHDNDKLSSDAWFRVTLLFLLAFFISLSLLIENPFYLSWITPNGEVWTGFFPTADSRLFIPAQGRGLNPLLRHVAMIFHPPLLYLGMNAFAIPFALAVSGAVQQDMDRRWLARAQKWMLFGWVFLTFGLVLGSRWAYDVLDWGGYWGWDPVEVAALLPWFSSAAFLHTVGVEMRSGRFHIWNRVLMVLTFDLVVLGVFFTRAGVLDSLHAYAQSNLGVYFAIFMAVLILLSIGLALSKSWKTGVKFRAQQKDVEAMATFVSGLLFCGLLMVCLVGLLMPLVSTWLIKQPVQLSPEQYKTWTAPLFAMLVAWMGLSPLAMSRGWTGRLWWIAPLTGLIAPIGMAMNGENRPVVWFGIWLAGMVLIAVIIQFAMLIGKKSESTRSVRLGWGQMGMWGIHAGAALLTLGVVGVEMLQTRTIATLEEGMHFQFRDLRVQYNGVKIEDHQDARKSTTVFFKIEKEGEKTIELAPRIDFFKEAQTEITVPAVSSSISGDVMLLLKNFKVENAVEVELVQSPLMVWVWIGGLLMGCAGLAILWFEK